MTSEERDLMLHVRSSVEKLGIAAFCKLSGMGPLTVRKCMYGQHVGRGAAMRAKAACDMADNPWMALLWEKSEKSRNSRETSPEDVIS